ncbi:MAG: hypothetical protein AABP62_22840 [Planctomycetota bacterium]
MNSSNAENRECCTDSKCESGLRNNYYEGKRLSVDSFRVEQQYLLERRRLLNRAIHGWGVVYGYKAVRSEDGRLEIGAGLALDQWGRELLETKTVIEVSDAIILGPKATTDGKENEQKVSTCPDVDKAEAALLSQKGDQKPQVWWLLRVHYAEQKSAPVTVESSCHCEHEEWDHTCETVRYSLQPVWSAECCSEFKCDLECNCGTVRCCDEPIEPDRVTLHKRGGCCCLCEHLTQLNPKGVCGPLYESKERCARVRVDIQNGVPLACVQLVKATGGWAFVNEDKKVEACGPRRLVKRNDLLFDLINGCDLTRIVEIGWKDWHRREAQISLTEFCDALGSQRDPNKYTKPGFWVKFSRPVRQGSLRPDCFAMTIISEECDDGWWETRRAPITGVDTTPFPGDPKDPVPVDPKDPNNLVRRARIVVDEHWLEELESTVRGRKSLLLRNPVRVELEVRGDFIIDCNGQTVDANAVDSFDPFAAPTGNGTPGGTFLSTFRVKPAQEAAY